LGDGFIGGGLRDDGRGMGGAWGREVFWERTRGWKFSKESVILERRFDNPLYQVKDVGKSVNKMR
jgi:hypothetical protein